MRWASLKPLDRSDSWLDTKYIIKTIANLSESAFLKKDRFMLGVSAVDTALGSYWQYKDH